MKGERSICLYFGKKGAVNKDAVDMGKLLKLIYGDQIEVKVGEGNKVLWDSTARQELPK